MRKQYGAEAPEFGDLKDFLRKITRDNPDLADFARENLRTAQRKIVRRYSKPTKASKNITLWESVSKPLTTEQRAYLVRMFRQLQHDYPVPGNVDVYVNFDMTLIAADPVQTGGSTTFYNKNGDFLSELDDVSKDRSDNAMIALNANIWEEKLLDDRNPNALPPCGHAGCKRDQKKFHPPSFLLDNVTKADFVIVHEWNHVVNPSDFDGTQQIAFKQSVMLHPSIEEHFLSSLPGYGVGDFDEARAEAFAEWVLTQGKTTVTFAKEFQKREKWPVPTKVYTGFAPHPITKNQPMEDFPVSMLTGAFPMPGYSRKTLLREYNERKRKQS